MLFDENPRPQTTFITVYGIHKWSGNYHPNALYHEGNHWANSKHCLTWHIARFNPKRAELYKELSYLNEFYGHCLVQVFEIHNDVCQNPIVEHGQLHCCRWFDNPVFTKYSHDDVIKWKHFPRYWSFVRGIHQWWGASMFSLIRVWTND